MDAGLPELSLGYFTVTTVRTEEALLLRLRGSADLRAMEALAGLLQAVHAEACRRELPEVAVDLRALESMSACCFQALSRWIEAVRQLPEGSRYRIRIRADPARRWQRRSLAALGRAAELGLGG